MISADCLVLLSDVDGLYSADPRRDPSARFIPDVHSISSDIERMAGGPVIGRRLRRDGDEDRGREDRRSCRVPHVDSDRP